MQPDQVLIACTSLNATRSGLLHICSLHAIARSSVSVPMGAKSPLLNVRQIAVAATLGEASFCMQARCSATTNAVAFSEYAQAWDFQDSDAGRYNVVMWSNSTNNAASAGVAAPPTLRRIHKARALPDLALVTFQSPLHAFVQCSRSGTCGACRYGSKIVDIKASYALLSICYGQRTARPSRWASHRQHSSTARAF